MSDTPQPTNRKLRRAGETSQQAYVYHAADSQTPPAKKATHITRSFTPPEPPATAGKPASTAGHARPLVDDASAATVGRDASIPPQPAGTARTRNGNAPSPTSVGDDARNVPGASANRNTPRADTEPAPTRDKAKPAAKTKPTKADKPSRKGRGKAKADTPPTPVEVIKAKRRRCADAEDIAGFFTKLIAIVVLIVLLFGFLFGLTPMENDDMAPRISAGDLLFYYRLADDWVTGDVMVFEKDGEQYVGRIVANPGDTVEVTDQATLVVNGSTVLENDIYYTTPKYDDGPAYPITLAQDEYFILCDYREGARDSRYFGPVKTGEIKGKVITVIRRSGL